MVAKLYHSSQIVAGSSKLLLISSKLFLIFQVVRVTFEEHQGEVAVAGVESEEASTVDHPVAASAITLNAWAVVTLVITVSLDMQHGDNKISKLTNYGGLYIMCR